MPRSMTSGMLAALQSPNPTLALLLSMAFRSETAYLWTQSQPVSWSGQPWLGGARVLSISPVEEGLTVEARGIVVGISGIDAVLLPEVLADYQLGGPVKVWLACLDASAAIIPDPLPVWTGRMDKPTVRMNGQTATIEIACETRFIDMNVAIDRRRTSDDQQLLSAGDLAFSFVNGIQETTITFGQSTIASRNV